ncbi:MAG: hypothetical protein ABSB25_05540 [Sedimentisphaerales bacterium]
MRYITLILSMVVLTSACLAEETLREIKWSDPNLRGKLTAGEIIEQNADCSFAQLRVQNSQNERKTFAILTINDPCIRTANYAITGQVRYSGANGMGYLEMWNHFPDGKMYFSRTVDDSGPMLSGSTNWLPFSLPFYINDATKMRPVKLDFNVVLIGPGTVYLGPLKLVQFEKDESAATSGAKNAWWNDRTAGWLLGGIGGGVGGSVIGTIWLIIGILTGLGTGRKVCFWLLGITFAFGLIVMTVGLGSGLAALAFSQPYAVWYPLLLLGFLLGMVSTILCLVLFRPIKLRYEQVELRKMHAMDIK